MRKRLLTSLLLAVLSVACDNAVGPGTVSVTQTTTSTTTTTIAPPTTAAFVFSPTAPRANQTIIFNAVTSSATVGRTIVLYAWNFGDIATATGVTASHTYSLEGTYNVTLTVTDSAGQVVTVAQVVPVVGTLTTTTTTVPPTSAAVRYVNTQVPPNVPTDMTLFYRLISGSTYAVQGIYNTISGVRGLVQGQFLGELTPAVSGQFTGKLTADVPGCTAERDFSGPTSVLLQWTAAPTITADCPGSPLSYSSFTLLKSDAPPATTTIAPAGSARRTPK